MDDKITHKDVKEYEGLFKLAPSFLLERFARKNSNIVLRFQSQIQFYLNNLNEDQRHKLDLILNSSIEELQAIMDEAYKISGVKQYKILANPKYKPFIKSNLDELKRLI